MSKTLRTCIDCGISAYTEGELSNFVKTKSYKYGRKNLCKPCSNKRQREARANSIHVLLRERISRIIQRCYNKNNTHHSHYGGRGIKVCEEWRNNPDSFIDWALEKNFERGHWIDRIDNDGNYTPSNCRFVTTAESNRNRSDTVTDFDNLTRICRICGVEKPLTAFHRDKSHSMGRKYICIVDSKIQRQAKIERYKVLEKKLEFIGKVLMDACEAYNDGQCQNDCDCDPNGYDGCYTRKILEVLSE